MEVKSWSLAQSFSQAVRLTIMKSAVSFNEFFITLFIKNGV
jgi:hypothetical protein